MSNGKSNQMEQPLHVWLPTVILKFLVFLAFAFVLFEATVGLGERDLTAGRVSVIVAGMGGLLLLLNIDRLTSLKLSSSGLEATLSETQAQALEEVGARVEDPQAAESARAQILQAKNPKQVREAVSEAVKLNVTRSLETVRQAIQDKHKCYVRYRPDPKDPVESYYVAPLDVKPGKTAATKDKDYLWAHSYDRGGIVSLRLDRVVGIEQSEDTFDPEELKKTEWKTEWNVPRDW